MNKWLALLVGLLLGLGLGAALIFVPGWLTQAQTRESLGLDSLSGSGQAGKTAPDFTLQELDGETLRLSDMQGRLVVLNFWATWCTPCVQEMPVLQQYAQRYPSELVVIGVNLQESRDTVQTFIKEIGISYPIVRDETGAVSDLFRVIGLPDTFLIDQGGVIRQRHIGSLSPDQLEAYLMQLGVGE